MNTRPVRRGRKAGRSRVAAVLAAAALLTVSACGSDDSSDDAKPAAGDGGKRVIETSDGKVTVPAKAERIVSISYATGALLDLGVEPVGTSAIDENNPMELLPSQKEQGKKITSIGSGIETNIEKVASLKPDLIIVEGAAAFDWKINRLKGIAPTLYFGIKTPGDLYDAQEKIARAVGKEDALDKLKATYKEKADKIKSTYADKLKSVKWALASSYGNGEFLVDTRTSWVGRVLSDVGAGFAKASADGKEHEVTYSQEKIDVLSDADVILVPRTAATGEVPKETKELQDKPSWKLLKAAKDGHVLPVTYATSDRYGTSIDVLDQIEKILKSL
ncbi:ABC transporter substrate-binding protein [Streptomyces mobaraensis NBRC 13819 = DSM 40847]|uniref:Iron(III) dicitrate transport permease n=1 Tax=Streptomyces mobaraensis (strain ATCC 29032 / DSM 40847 / JCM 4168 / NBRC 13819 / NCIMB 11159 / IPCR 16-22) TaxID=1223523 RepID=M3B9V1_STRM1|nr:ABC transporter substrate-binding protein [Streptomyces mobaraensis]EME96309.1 iron(III) dicitrate transport permease [Streptomyces mobaraensis NBRC 13819 = DSM 40847]QTT72246.1 ABC transporter substrate-binding protein [Streptomyces mobaraensis NBRC 13819 = DSM 40847]